MLTLTYKNSYEFRENFAFNICFVYFQLFCMILNATLLMFIFVRPLYVSFRDNIEILKLFSILICCNYVQAFVCIKSIFQTNSSGHAISICVMLSNSIICYILYRAAKAYKPSDQYESFYLMVILFLFQAIITFIHRYMRCREFYMYLFHKVGPSPNRIKTYNCRRSLLVFVEIDLVINFMFVVVRLSFFKKNSLYYPISTFVLTIIADLLILKNIDNENSFKKKLATFLKIIEIIKSSIDEKKAIYKFMRKYNHKHLISCYTILIIIIINCVLLFYNIKDHESYGQGLRILNTSKTNRKFKL